MGRHKDASWNVPDHVTTWEQANTALLMDIRDELKGIRALLNCHRIPKALDAIAKMDRLGIKRRAARKRKS